MCGSYKQRAGPVSTMRSRLRLRGQYLALQLGTARARAPWAEELRAVLDAATPVVHVLYTCAVLAWGQRLGWIWSGTDLGAERQPCPGVVGTPGVGVARWRRRVTLLTERRYCSAGLAAPRIQRLRLRPRPSSRSSEGRARSIGGRARSSGARARSVGGRDLDGIAEARERRQCGPYLGAHRIAPWMHRVAGLQA